MGSSSWNKAESKGSTSTLRLTKKLTEAADNFGAKLLSAEIHVSLFKIVDFYVLNDGSMARTHETSDTGPACGFNASDSLASRSISSGCGIRSRASCNRTAFHTRMYSGLRGPSRHPPRPGFG